MTEELILRCDCHGELFCCLTHNDWEGHSYLSFEGSYKSLTLGERLRDAYRILLGRPIHTFEFLVSPQSAQSLINHLRQIHDTSGPSQHGDSSASESPTR